MSTHEDFPAELVEQRAQELYDAAWGAGEWEEFAHGALRDRYRVAARLSLRREVEACEPLVKALEEDVKVYAYHDLIASEERVEEVLRAHRARYAPATTPAPDSLSELAREAAEALRGNAALSERLLAAVEREKVQP